MSRLRGPAVAAALALLVGCESSPTGVDPVASEACVPPATTISASALEGVDRAGLRSALLDAADRGAAGPHLEGPDAAELRVAVQGLARSIERPDPAPSCQLIHRALEALERQPDDPATLPDRIALRLVLDLGSAVLVRESP